MRQLMTQRIVCSKDTNEQGDPPLLMHRFRWYMVSYATCISGFHETLTILLWDISFKYCKDLSASLDSVAVMCALSQVKFFLNLNSYLNKMVYNVSSKSILS